MGYFLAVTATFIWAGNFIVARALNRDILPMIGLAFWRWAIAVATLAPFAVRSTVEDWKLVQKYFPFDSHAYKNTIALKSLTFE